MHGNGKKNIKELIEEELEQSCMVDEYFNEIKYNSIYNEEED